MQIILLFENSLLFFSRNSATLVPNSEKYHFFPSFYVPFHIVTEHFYRSVRCELIGML